MGKLMIFNLILVALIAIGLCLIKKYVKRERTKNLILGAAAIFTILFHYSSFCFKLLTGGNAMDYLSDTPNLILPIYPCNVVMWSALIFALLKNKHSKRGAFFADYLFWFGIVSTLVGMFANVDFINNPTLADYENVKSIAAHATLLFNVLLLPVFGYIKIDVKRNLTNIIASIIVMAAIGGYCNLVFYALSSAEAAYDVNSMFLIHSPFEGLDFLTYPVIALIAVPIYFIVFAICDLVAHKKGERFYNKAKTTKNDNMKLKNFLIVVKDIEKSRKFYHDLFGIELVHDNDGNMILTEGLVLQDEKIWKSFLDRDIVSKSNSCELYFEEQDIESFVEKLESLYPGVEYVNRLMTHSWGQRVIRFYDLDGNLIEVGTPV